MKFMAKNNPNPDPRPITPQPGEPMPTNPTNPPNKPPGKP